MCIICTTVHEGHLLIFTELGAEASASQRVGSHAHVLCASCDGDLSLSKLNLLFTKKKKKNAISLDVGKVSVILTINLFLSISCNRPALFTSTVSQIYGCFFPQDLVTSHFNNVPNNGIQYLESTLHTLVLSTSAFVQTSDKLSGCQEQPLLKWYS